MVQSVRWTGGIVCLGLLLAGLSPWAVDVAGAAEEATNRFANPPLPADFPDPDIIRVGSDFYFITTTFVNVPGLTLLQSRDLVHWRYAGHVVDRLDGRPQYDMQDGVAYRSGIFAPSLRHHDGRFWVVVTPLQRKTRVYQATRPEGPWTMHELDVSAFDPGLFFDDDGRAYIVTSGGWDGTISLLSLNEDLTQVTATEAIHFIEGAEGCKLVKRAGWYYLFNSIPRRLGMTISRSRDLRGPWETRPSIDDRTGGHQGAIVDLPDGRWFGFAMKDDGAIGRVTQISPMFWQDDWPIWGTPEQPNRIPDECEIPIPGQPRWRPATSDDFESASLGLQWQWNHNPDPARWSLSERPGWLRLKATRADGFWTARNSLTQKAWGPWCRGQVRVDASGLKDGDVAGFGTLGKFNGLLTVQRIDDGHWSLQQRLLEATRSGTRLRGQSEAVTVETAQLWLRTDLDFETDEGRVAFSLDGRTWQPLGDAFPLAYDWQTGTFQGQQFVLFCYAPAPDAGTLDVDRFDLIDERPTAASDWAWFDDFEIRGLEGEPVSLEVGDGRIRNPILPGFHPDPSLCRVGDDYYLVTSTFEYFPGLPIFHSRDLVHWRQLGHVIDRADQLDYTSGRVGGGLFAPAITYHDGLFYVVCTHVDNLGNFVVTARNPAGPWSAPTRLDFGGIDPSLFFDDDGSAWIVNNDAPPGPPRYDGHRAIWLQQFDPVERRVVGPRTVLVDGGVDPSTQPIWIEGPHLYKRKDWYYLCCAEGGTGPGHSQVILRSRRVTGPYEPWSRNPILTQRDLDGSVPGAVTCTGHADLEIGPDGRWWAVFLGVRPDAQGRSPMGRETFLLPVQWTEDDWPVILPPGRRVPIELAGPRAGGDEPPAGWQDPYAPWRDSFESWSLSHDWIMLREPETFWWRLEPEGGRLGLRPRTAWLDGLENSSYLAKRVRHRHFVATLTLAAPGDGVSAGLVLFMTERAHVFVGLRRQTSVAEVFVEQTRGGPRRLVTRRELPLAASYRLRLSQRDFRGRIEASAAGQPWQVVAENLDLSTISSTAPGGMFVGATVGPAARLDRP